MLSAHDAALVARPTGFPVRHIRDWALGLVIFASGFVFFEPAAYEYLLVLVMGTWMLCGLRVHRAIGPLIILMLLFVAGGVLAITQSRTIDDEPIYTAVSLFLALSSCFFAAVVASEPRNHLDTIANAWIAAACGSTALGMFGYFGLAPEGYFTLYGRAAGGFQDPNVFAPFLVFPLLVLVQRIMTRRAGAALLSTLLAMFILAGTFLSFSRGGWALTALTGAILIGIMFLNERNPAKRAKYIVLAMFGIGLCALLTMVAISTDAVGSLFFERAQIVQEHDGRETGRFARHAAGFSLMLGRPLGLGALEFAPMFHGDEHNIWLKALTTNGWLGFLAYLILTIWTLAAAFPLMFRQSEFQHYAQIAFVVFLGHILLASIIDIDHWRHVYILFGILWGLIAADKRRQQDRLVESHTVG